ncbi:enolase-phosphatase E1-like [Zeugodacus cucurbitae]|uniref:enolase-phosphatase E1 n=1 Tax=Zeugodacus cucurbitae TaxID=28588 RepID=UPI0023D93674|nr:enolase-phosphatase E1 [Zeugodacus cucurbitae]XP_054085067.1 enolase-phosphatase E1-like [Zeugodacus cucurbitae]
MSLKLYVFATLSILLYTSAPIQAGVLRADKPSEAPVTEVPANVSEQPESTTIQIIVGDEVALSRDEDATVKIAVASLDPAPGTVEGIEITLETVGDKAEEPKPTDAGDKQTDEKVPEKKDEPALSRDEAATIKVKAHETDDLAQSAPASSAETIGSPQKSSKLLLLSTPRLAREQEENIAEPEDVDINTAVSTDDTTELSVEIELDTDKSSEESAEDKKTTTTEEPSFLTRVRDAIFGKKTEEETTKATLDKKEEAPKPSDEVLKADKEEIKKDDEVSIPAAAEQTPEPHNDNAATAVLIETEADYVLVDSDVEHLEHLGSFTHAESEEYLQPIVHSVEVVPSHFEEPLLFSSSYVHAW